MGTMMFKMQKYKYIICITEPRNLISNRT